MPTRQSVLDTVFLTNPSYLMIGELSLFITTAILGWLLSWSKMPLFPILNLIGCVLFLAATGLHILCGQAHKQAHVEAKNITHIVMVGAYSKVRHPLYLSLIFMNIGIGLISGIVCAFILTVVAGVLSVYTSLKEEKFLLKKFPKDYTEYMELVKWRMIPGLF